MKKITKFCVWFFKIRWIVNKAGEMGVRIAGMNFWYYKHGDPLVSYTEDCATWRFAEKREFGEVVKSQLRLLGELTPADKPKPMYKNPPMYRPPETIHPKGYADLDLKEFVKKN